MPIFTRQRYQRSTVVIWAFFCVAIINFAFVMNSRAWNVAEGIFSEDFNNMSDRSLGIKEGAYTHISPSIAPSPGGGVGLFSLRLNSTLNQISYLHRKVGIPTFGERLIYIARFFIHNSCYCLPILGTKGSTTNRSECLYPFNATEDVEQIWISANGSTSGLIEKGDCILTNRSYNFVADTWYDLEIYVNLTAVQLQINHTTLFTRAISNLYSAAHDIELYCGDMNQTAYADEVYVEEIFIEHDYTSTLGPEFWYTLIALAGGVTVFAYIALRLADKEQKKKSASETVVLPPKGKA